MVVVLVLQIGGIARINNIEHSSLVSKKYCAGYESQQTTFSENVAYLEWYISYTRTERMHSKC